MELRKDFVKIAALFLISIIFSIDSQTNANTIYICFDAELESSSTNIIIPGIASSDKNPLVLNKASTVAGSSFCPNGVGTFVVSKSLSSAGSESIANSTTQLPFNSITEEGYLQIGKDYFSRTEYCIQTLSTSLLQIRVCEASCSAKSLIQCIPKCCDLHEMVQLFPSQTNFSCVPAPMAQTLSAETSFSLQMEPEVHFKVQKLKCNDEDLIQTFFRTEKQQPPPALSSKFDILLNGSAIVRQKQEAIALSKSQSFFIPFGKYCADLVQIRSPDQTAADDISLEYNNYEVLITCSSSLITPSQDVIPVIPILYCILMIISCLLLMVTFLVHIILWEKQKFYMWIVMAYVLSLFLLYIFLGLSNLSQFLRTLNESNNYNDYGDDLTISLSCVILGAASHLFILSTLFWLTAINSNLWSNFKNLSISSRIITSDEEEQHLRRFVWVSLLAWGTPAFIVGCGLCLDYFYKNAEDVSPVLLPNYGSSQCLLSTKAEGWYLYYPAGILLGFNVLFFVLTVFRMILCQKFTRNIIGDRSERKWKLVNTYQQLLMCALFIGIFEFSAWILKLQRFTYYWMLVELLNLFQSVLIFIIFTCRKKILEQLGEKYQLFSRFSSPLCEKNNDN